MRTERELMPAVFFGHGSPMNAIEENEFVAGFRHCGEAIPRPNAVVCISAHWETEGTFVTAVEKPATIHDFGGFPKALYEVEYPAPGNPDLAREITSLVSETEIGLDMAWGLDHGTWSVLKHLYPQADVPVIQMSLDFTQSPQYHYDLARALRPLRKKGVLVIGSGNMVHNLGLVAWDRLSSGEFGFEWAFEAKEHMKNLIVQGDHHALINYRSLGPAFDRAIPTPEHYLPLLYILALQEEGEQVTFFNDTIVGGSIGMTAFKIGGV